MIPLAQATIIGVDPGIHGGIAIVRGPRVEFLDAPKHRPGQWMDLTRYREAARQGSLESATVVLEDAIQIPGHTSRATVATIFFNFGRLYECFDGAGLTPKIVKPLDWKKFWGLTGKKKEDSIVKAAEAFPAYAATLISDARAEALLIADYWRRTQW